MRGGQTEGANDRPDEREMAATTTRQKEEP